MSEPFLAEIRLVGFTFAPRGWALCDGQILPISQNQSLYSLLGTTYGGDGRVSFALPDLRGRTPMHFGEGFQLGQKGGEETHTLNIAELPQHTHVVNGTDTVGSQLDDPEGHLLASASQTVYGSMATPTAMKSGTVANAGGGQAHDNMQPFLALFFCIALQGLFPSRN